MLLCNFNVNNLFVRYKFGKTFPGDQGGKSRVTNPNVGYLPLYQKGAFEVFNAEQRKLAALAITQGNTVLPDVVCIQEVESLIALREFNERFLAAAYPYAVVLDSRDLRQIDVGILSKYPLDSIATHVDDTVASKYIFSRDCLEVRLRVKRPHSSPCSSTTSNPSWRWAPMKKPATGSVPQPMRSASSRPKPWPSC
ncbi:hypothetical protein LP415_08320 [Polaromonas sp. P1(28)-8]|nr:hypothetical protein LP415_08320 [Polaromonas sp. P1(28)-8]